MQDIETLFLFIESEAPTKVSLSMSPASNQSKGPLIIGLGESLFDCFPDREQLGGAPINLTVHARALVSPLGGEGMVATAVGDDELGKRFLSLIAEHGVTDQLVQVDPDHPTGRVDIHVDEAGQPTYEFQADVAWDHLQFSDAWNAAAAQCAAVCYGTLAQRCDESRQAIQAFLQAAPQALRLFDVNLRQDFYSAEILHDSFKLATAAKLNIDELPVVLELLELPDSGELKGAADALLEKFDLQWLAITRGSEGTALFAEGELHQSEVPSYERHPNADSVGAGDACGAGLMASALLEWSYGERVWLANQMGAFVASQPGATPRLPKQLLDRIQQK